MNVLTETYTQLSTALIADSLFLLASAVATFDPFWNMADDYEYEPDPLEIALHVTRDAFPDVYAETVEQMRFGAAYADLDRLICKAITAKGIPLDDLYMMSWGIPLQACGAELTGPEFYEAHADLLPVLALFGIVPPRDEAEPLIVLERAYDTGRPLALHLLEQDDPALREVGWLLGWLFSCTGNSLVDCSDEGLNDFEPLAWSEENVDFAVEMIAEADEIMGNAMSGLQHLLAMSSLCSALQRNIAIIQQKGTNGERRIELEWSGFDSSADGETVTHAGVLQLRADAA
jgi:hypothetical protein